MEKLKPSYLLDEIKESFNTGSDVDSKITHSALRGAKALSFSMGDIVALINSLKPVNFYKSMTTYRDHKVWQDVYHASYKGKDIYLKILKKESKDLLIVSFKEK